jgi:phosphoribosylformylglycinamidine cyclo-ligase
VIDTRSWKTPAIFQHIERAGRVEHAEMYQVFNMGIGMAVIVDEKDRAEAVRRTKGKVIGEIQAGTGTVRLRL